MKVHPESLHAMDRQWLPLNALRAFEAAGRLGSFTAAAASLTVAQSAVSRHVIALERFLGVPLFERRPGQLALTEAGRHLLPAVTRSFDRIDRALGEIIAERGMPRRMLRLALPPSFALQLAVPILRDVRAEHPELAIEIGTRVPGEGEGALAVVYSEPTVSDAIDDLLWMERLAVVCAPAALSRVSSVDTRNPAQSYEETKQDRVGEPTRSCLGEAAPDLAALVARHDLLHVRLGGRPHGQMWRLMARAAGRPDLAVDGGLVFDTAQLAVQYALAGDGLALVDPVLFAADLAAGRLVAPFDTRLASGYGYYLVTAPEDLDEAVALFRSWLIRRFAAQARTAPDAEAAP